MFFPRHSQGISSQSMPSPVRLALQEQAVLYDVVDCHFSAGGIDMAGVVAQLTQIYKREIVL